MSQVRLALVGPAGSGKDYFAEYVRKNHGGERIAFADELKYEFGCLLLDLLKERTIDPIGWINEHKHIPQVRAYLQAAGEVLCALGGEEFWAAKALKWLDEDDDDAPVLVITDCRKVPEANYAADLGFYIVRIVRTDNYAGPGITEETAQHRSETEQSQIEPHFEIENPGTEEFDANIEALLEFISG